MATLAQANTYHAVRGNEDWADLAGENPVQASALLEDAETYIRSVYNVRTDLSTDEQKLLDGLVCRLAGTFIKNPPADASAPTIKKQSSELKGMKKETEFNEAASDLYPYITAVVRPLTYQPIGFSIGRMRRR